MFGVRDNGLVMGLGGDLIVWVWGCNRGRRGVGTESLERRGRRGMCSESLKDAENAEGAVKRSGFLTAPTAWDIGVGCAVQHGRNLEECATGSVGTESRERRGKRGRRGECKSVFTFVAGTFLSAVMPQTNSLRYEEGKLLLDFRVFRDSEPNPLFTIILRILIK